MANALDALLRWRPFTLAGAELTTRGAVQAGTGIELSDDPATKRTIITATGAVSAISPLTTKGDLYTRGASADARLPVGSNGSIVVADSGEAVGMRWAAAITDTQHGNRAGGGLHANAVAGVSAGFMSAADKTKLDAIESGATADPPLADVLAVGAAAGGVSVTGLGNIGHDAGVFENSGDLAADIDGDFPATTDVRVLRINDTTLTSLNIDGLLAGLPAQSLFVVNTTASTFVFVNDNATTPADGILNPGGTNHNLPPGATAHLIYDSTSSRWRLVAGAVSV